MYQLKHGDCRLLLAEMEPDSVDAVVTDPPYGLSKEPDMVEVLRHWLAGDDYTHSGGGFMGKSWDSFVPGPATWREVFRVLKPGGYALVFAGTRTQDLMTVALRLAGFEIRDSARYWYEDDEPMTPDEAKAAAQTGGGLAWGYGSGFPKSLDIFEMMQWRTVESENMKRRAVVGQQSGSLLAVAPGQDNDRSAVDLNITAPHTEAAKQWDGWGTALKPAYEPIIVARKPLIGTVADNVLTHGVGGLNIDGCRVGRVDGDRTEYGVDGDESSAAGNGITSGHRGRVAYTPAEASRWPANVLHDDCFNDKAFGRFFYCPKATKADRNAGLDDLPTATAGEVTGGRAEGSAGLSSPRAGAGRTSGAKNIHPTVKPTELMRYLCRLVTPPGGLVLDPFAGSGSTGRGALLEGFRFIGLELTDEYLPIAEARLQDALLQWMAGVN